MFHAILTLKTRFCHLVRLYQDKSVLAARVAQWIRRTPPKGEIVGSSPIVGDFVTFWFFLRHLKRLNSKKLHSSSTAPKQPAGSAKET